MAFDGGDREDLGAVAAGSLERSRGVAAVGTWGRVSIAIDRGADCLRPEPHSARWRRLEALSSHPISTSEVADFEGISCPRYAAIRVALTGSVGPVRSAHRTLVRTDPSPADGLCARRREAGNRPIRLTGGTALALIRDRGSR